MELVRTLLLIARALERHGVDYAIVGGAAVNLHGLVRATQDIDLFIAPSRDNVEKLKQALREVWDDPCIDEISAEELCGSFPAVRYGPPTGSVYLDILTRLGDVTRYTDLEIETVELDSVPVRVASPRTLVRMKKDTVRPIDHADARALVEAFGLTDEDAG